MTRHWIPAPVFEEPAAYPGREATIARIHADWRRQIEVNAHACMMRRNQAHAYLGGRGRRTAYTPRRYTTLARVGEARRLIGAGVRS